MAKATSQTVIIQASGLITSPNQLNLPGGSLAEAANVVIRRENVIEPRRGFSVFGSAYPLDTDRTKQISIYRKRILRHFGSKIQYDSTGNGDFISFDGNYIEASLGHRLRSVEANGNHYFASSLGIKRISSPTPEKLSAATVVGSGVTRALDIKPSIFYEYKSQTGILPSDSAVAYRVVFATRDSNENLLRSSPSGRAIVYNSLQQLLVNDFMRVLIALDNITDTTTSARISQGDYVSTLQSEASSGAGELLLKLTSLTDKLDSDIIYGDDGTAAPIDLVGASGTCQVVSNLATITRQSGNFNEYLTAGSEIEITGLAGGNAVLNGKHTVASATATQITFSVTTANFGPTATDAAVKLTSNEYRDIIRPTTPSSPATHGELVIIQTYLDSIITRLQAEPPIGSLTGIVISSSNRTAFTNPLDLTSSANVKLVFDIPESITTDYFYQIYRSPTTIADSFSSIEDISPSDELQLASEVYLTAAEIAAGMVSVTDLTPEEFLGENLYTNAGSGEGITQSNDTPPLAEDINRFRNVVFYANTKTKYRMQISLLGVEKLVAAPSPKIEIVSSLSKRTYSFVNGATEVTDLTCIADTANSLNGDYFDIYSANDEYHYRFYYKTSGGVDSPPVSGGADYVVPIYVITGSSANVVAGKTRDALNVYPDFFNVVDNTLPKIRITNKASGYTTNLSATGVPGFSVTYITQGVGESITNKQIAISNSISAGTKIEETARSIIRIINTDDDGLVYASYLSSGTDTPGKILLESRELTSDKFYVIADSSDVGSTFNPDISPESLISAINTATDIITTSQPHGLVSGDSIVVAQSNTTPNIDGIYTVERISTTEIKIGVDITAVGSIVGSISKESYASSADNESKSNRIYYSKYLQPEAVPIVNYFDVGAEDRKILRIYPLRDSLFVFKEDGLYRVSGEVAPFNVQLFDSSTILIAQDSLGVVDNLIFAWTLKGIVSISENGVENISRSIDNIVLKQSSNKFVNFKQSTWGMGYESDNAYIVFTVSDPSDTSATIGYRYNKLTNSWTTILKNFTCGTVNETDDTMYVGAGDLPNIEKERKNFDRTDHADREYTHTLPNNKYTLSSRTMLLPDVSTIKVGDAIVQDQTLTIYRFNTLLKQIDSDPSSVSSYFATIPAVPGNNLRTKIEELAGVLDLDTGVAQTDFATSIASQVLTISDISVQDNSVITTTTPHNLFTGRRLSITGSNSTPSVDGNWEVTVLTPTTFSIDKEVLAQGSAGSIVTLNNDFDDIYVCFNKIVEKLNDDGDLAILTYVPITGRTSQEAIVTAVSSVKRQITVNLGLEFVSGPLTSYRSISSSFAYSPITMGDPINWKHVSYAQILFENRAFTSGEMHFATDLHPAYEVVKFSSDGNGIFGHSSFGEGHFGGESNSAPMRTIVPRNTQRCIFMRVKIKHSVSREFYNVYGISLTGKVGTSNRAYR